MRQVTSRETTGRYAVVKIFPFIHAVKVEVRETWTDENNSTHSGSYWRLATDKDILELSVPTMAQSAPERIGIKERQ